VSPDAVPCVVIYDPMVAASLPPKETAQSGMNSLAHSVEALYVPDANRLSDILATEGARALFDGLPGCVERPSDLGARATAMYGGLLGGLLVAMVGIGLHHKICHLLGGRFGLPHGVSNGIILPQVIAFNAPAMPEAIDRLASAIGEHDPSAACFSLAKRLGLPLTLREVGVAEADLAPVVEDIVAGQIPNPRPTDRAAVTDLLHRAWSGELPRSHRGRN
jgi:alcohol dehydrogenase class IV